MCGQVPKYTGSKIKVNCSLGTAESKSALEDFELDLPSRPESSRVSHPTPGKNEKDDYIPWHGRRVFE